MATHKKINERTPSGGAYAEIFFFDKNGKAVDESEAFRCVIRECKANGELISETWGTVNE